MTSTVKTAGQALSDPARLEALEFLGLLQDLPEESLDRYTKLAAHALDVPVSLMSLVEKDRQFFKSQVGLPEPYATLRATPLTHSFCQHVVTSGAPLVIDDASAHALVRDNLAIPDLGVQAYLGFPLKNPDGLVLGSFCAIDSSPRHWTQKQMDSLQTIAEAVNNEIKLRAEAAMQVEIIAKLQATEAARDDMVHLVVHDIRTPLSSMLNGLEMLKDFGPMSGEQTEIIQLSQQAGKQLLRMIGDMLDLHRIKAVGLELAPVECDPGNLLETALDLVRHLARRKNLQLEKIVATDGCILRADGPKIIRVLVNLLGNAIKFTRYAGVIQISAEVLPAAAQIRFQVRDNGCGIPEEELAGIFDKFQTGATGINRSASTGIGLAFCRNIVEGHGGRITVESKPGEGSTFSFVLPLSPPALANEVRAGSSAPPPPTGQTVPP